MDENSNFDIVFDTKVNNGELDDLEKKIQKLESKGVNITANYIIKENDSPVEASKLNKVNEAIGRILNMGGRSEIINKTFKVKFDSEGLRKEVLEGLRTLSKIRPDIMTDQATLQKTFDNLKSEFLNLNSEITNMYETLGDPEAVESFGNLQRAMQSGRKDSKTTKEAYEAMVDEIGMLSDTANKAYGVLNKLQTLLKIDPSLDFNSNIKGSIKTLESFSDETKQYKDDFKALYTEIGVSASSFGRAWNNNFKLTQDTIKASDILPVPKEIKQLTKTTDAIENAGKGMASPFQNLEDVIKRMIQVVKIFKDTFDSVNETTLSPMSQTVSVLQEYIHATNNTIRALESNVGNVNKEVGKLDQTIGQLSNVESKDVKIKVDIQDNGLKVLSDILNEIDNKTHEINIDFVVPNKLDTIAKSIKMIADGLKKIESVESDVLSKHIEIKQNNKPKESNPDTTTSPPPPETPVDPDIINNLASIGTKLNSIYEKLNQTINVDFAEDSLLKSQLMHNDESVEPIYEESLTERIVDIQNRLEWTNDFISEAIETKENTEQNDTTTPEVNNLLNTIIEAINNLISKFDSPIQVESVDNEQSVNEVFYKTQIATLADSINKSIANANNKDNYADVVGKKLDNIIAQLGKTFKTEVTNFSALVNSSGGLLTQAQLAQLMQLLQKNQPTIVNSGASKTQDNTVGGIENAASDRQRAFEISSTVKENYDLFEFLDKSLKETNSQLPHTTAGFNELYEQMRVIYSNIEDVVKKINKANLSEEKRKELMEELEEHNRSFGNWQKKNISDINTLLSYSQTLPITTNGNPAIVKRAATLGQDITTYFDSVKKVFDSFEYIKRYFDNHPNATSQPIDDFEHKFNEILTFYTNAESMLKKVQRPNLSGNTVNQIKEDLYSQDQGFTDYLQKESHDIQTVSDLAISLREIISESEKANEKLETLRSTIKMVEAAGGNTEKLKVLEYRLGVISNYSKNPYLAEEPEVYESEIHKAYEDYDDARLTMFNFDGSNIEIDDFSKKVQKLKKLLKQLRDSGGETQKILANIGNLDNNQLEALSNNFESRKNEYIVNAASAQGKDADFLKEQYFGNSIQPLIEYINRLDEVTEAVNNFTTAQKESNKAMKEQEQADNAAIAFQKKYEETVKRLGKWGDDNSKALKDPYFAKAYEELTNRISMGAIQSDKDLNKLRADMSALDRTVKEAGVSGKTFGNVLGELYKKYGGWAFVTKSLNYTVRLLKDMVTQVHEVDTAMTNLRKVTDANERQLKQYLDTAGGRSVDIGATLTDYVDATSEFSRLGKSLNEAENLGKLATVYKTVGDDLDIQTASQSIISTMQAYEKIGVTAEEIVDKFNYTGNNFAITSKGVGDALQRSAASLNAAGNDLNESIGLITSANTIVQNTETVGTALKSISARIRGTTDQLGEDAEEMTITTAELRDKIKSITRIDIMQDENTFKSTYQILKEISGVYDTLTDSQQADIAEMLGGKVGLNTVQAILGNFETAEKVVEDLNEGLAEGSASKELESSLDSIDGKLNQLKSTWQQLSVDTVNSEAVKFLIDGAKTLLELLDGIAKNGAAAGAGIATAFGLTGLQMKTGSGRAKMFALSEYARVSSGGNTERVDIVFVISTRELWKNYRTWCIAQRVL